MTELAPIALGIIFTVAIGIVGTRMLVRTLREQREARLKKHLSWAGARVRTRSVPVERTPNV